MFGVVVAVAVGVIVVLGAPIINKMKHVVILEHLRMSPFLWNVKQRLVTCKRWDDAVQWLVECTALAYA